MNAEEFQEMLKQQDLQVAQWKREAEAGRALYKFMDQWFKKYPSTSKAVKSLHRYEKKTRIEERNAHDE